MSTYINPLKKLRSKVTCEDMAEKTGLHINTIYNLVDADEDYLLNCPLSTFMIIKEKLGVDLAKGINY